MEGYFGDFAGSFVPPVIKDNLDRLCEVFTQEKDNREFKAELEQLLKNYSGRPTPLYFAENLSNKKGVRIYLKREDLNHTGAHRINNTLGQALLAKKMGRKKLVAETGAGMHGVAVATAAAKFNMECVIFQGAHDVGRQNDNTRKMKVLGTEIVPVNEGEQTLKEAADAAIRYWIENAHDTFYMPGSVVEPHPYPSIVRYFQSVIGNETKKQIIIAEGRLPDKVIAYIDGGSNAIGIFSAFIEDEAVELIGVEAAGEGFHTPGHAAALTTGKTSGKRLTVAYCDDEKAKEALFYLSATEGIIPAIESAHAISWVLENDFKKDEIVIINLSGRGDRDLARIL